MDALSTPVRSTRQAAAHSLPHGSADGRMNECSTVTLGRRPITEQGFQNRGLEVQGQNETFSDLHSQIVLPFPEDEIKENECRRRKSWGPRARDPTLVSGEGPRREAAGNNTEPTDGPNPWTLQKPH